MKVDMVVMRHPNPGAAGLSQHVDASINAGDGATNINSGLVDAFSIREKLGTLQGVKIIL